MATPGDIRLLALDWGTTSFRAYALGEHGVVLDRRQAGRGILSVADGAFEAALRGEIGDWLDGAPDVPTLAAGMITSRQGWCELPYLGCPADAPALGAGLRALALADGRAIHFVPGLETRDGDGVPDVMRGEEVQVFGALGRATEGVFLLPGTHSKWVCVEAGRIERFATFMTGEVFAALKGHTILGRMMAEGGDPAAGFRRGAGSGLAAGGGLLHRLFSVRTLALAGELGPEEGAGYLSGLLIGSEIAAGRDWLGAAAAGRPINLVGRGDLCARYAEALALAGLAGTAAPELAAAAGLWHLAVAAALVDG